MDGDAELSISQFNIQSSLKEECALLTGAYTELGLGVVEATERDEAARFLEIDLAAGNSSSDNTNTPPPALLHTYSYILSILRPSLELETRSLAIRLSCDTPSSHLSNRHASLPSTTQWQHQPPPPARAKLPKATKKLLRS
jgi:hypothetical protein